MYSVNDFNNANTIEIPDNIIETFNKLNRSFTKKNLQEVKIKKTIGLIVIRQLNIDNKITLKHIQKQC